MEKVTKELLKTFVGCQVAVTGEAPLHRFAGEIKDVSLFENGGLHITITFEWCADYNFVSKEWKRGQTQEYTLSLVGGVINLDGGGKLHVHDYLRQVVACFCPKRFMIVDPTTIGEVAVV